MRHAAAGVGADVEANPVTTEAPNRGNTEPAKITLFLVVGDPKRLRTATLSNWNGKAIAAPRTDLEDLLAREEIRKPGVYLLMGTNSNTGNRAAYIGEAEELRKRLKQHRDEDFWNHVVVFFSTSENLTKSHIKYLEGRLIEEAKNAARVTLENSQSGGAKLPESDRAEMEVFLDKIRLLLPALGSDVISPVLVPSGDKRSEEGLLVCAIKGLKAQGRRTPAGFVVLKGSEAVLENRPSSAKWPWTATLRKRLIEEGTLLEDKACFRFSRDTEFASPSAAAAVIHGGHANGLTAWKDKHGKTLKELEAP